MASTKTKNSGANSAMKSLQIPSPLAAVRIKEEPRDASPTKKLQTHEQSAATASVKSKPHSTAAALRPIKAEPFLLPAPAIEDSLAGVALPPSEVSTAAMAVAAEGNAEEEPPILKAMADLRGLSSALSTFNLRFEELQLHLDSIKESIAKKLPELGDDKTQETASLEPEQPAKSTAAPDEVLEEALDGEQEPPAISTDAQAAESSAPGLFGLAEQPHLLEVICQTMNGKKLRKYVASQLNKIQMLREEIPDALKRFAPDPARLTLNSLCRFFVQGSKAYANKNSAIITLRRAAIRILEFFILAGCPKVEDAVRAEAEASAVLWKIRLFREGGVTSACYEDAVGLVLLISAYRLASVFEIDDLGKLVEVSQVWKKAGALRRAPPILEFIQGIIERMLKNDMHVQAITLVLRFDLKDKFDLESLISSFLNKTDKSEKKMKEEAQGSPEAIKEACEQTLSSLKSVVKCAKELRYSSEKLSIYKIEEKIASLEKDIVNFAPKVEQEKTAQKRKAKELGSSENTRHQAVKRNQPTTAKFSGPPTNAVVQAIEKTLHDEPQSHNIFVNPNFPGLVDGYSAASVKPAAFLPDGNVMGLATANTLGTFGTIGSGVGLSSGSGVGPYPVTGNLSPLGNSSRLPTGSGIGPYGWKREVAFDSPSSRQSLLGGFPPSVPGQSQTQPSTSTMPSFLGQLHREPGPDLYRFADMVLDGKSYQDSSSHLGKAPVVVQPQAPIYNQRSYY